MSIFVRFGSRCIINLDQVCGISYSKSEGVPCVIVTLSNGSMGHHDGLGGHGATGRYEFHGHEADEVWMYFNNVATDEGLHDAPLAAQPMPLDLVAMANAEEG